ncbi:MAG: HAMP domain-containing sensor histidine kinase [Acidobacteriota bacterium]
MMNDKNVRRSQLVFLVVLAISAGQVLWWLLDQSLFAQQVHDKWRDLYEADVHAAVALLDRGARVESIEELFPHLDVSLDEVKVSSTALHHLAEDKRSHLSQYAWEGLFFLGVLFTGMWIIVRAVGRDAQLRRWQTNFLAAVTHELKSPLASLQLAAETLEMRDSDAAYRKRLIGRMLVDLDRLSSTVSKVLTTERLDQRKMELERCELDLASLVQETLGEYRLRAQGAGIEFSIDVPEGLCIEADPIGARTVLRNLFDNALKATEPGGGSISVAAVETSGGINLHVSDTGVGFPPQEAKQLFEKFYRVGNELRRTRTGTGLGLYLARRFMEVEGGVLSARSAGPGHGASFTATWPREIA